VLREVLKEEFREELEEELKEGHPGEILGVGHLFRSPPIIR